MNTAVSFATTTTWQAYGGETTLSYFSQVVGLVAQNFLAGAAGLAVGIAFIRGLARERTRLLGQLLGRPRAGAALGPPAGLAGGEPGARLAGCAAELPRVPERPAPAGHRRREWQTGRHPTPPHGAGGGARIHQEPRHQRRRLLQRERRASLREPYTAGQPDHAAGDRGRPGRLDTHVRTDGRPAPPGLVAFLGDGRALCRWSPRVRLGRAAGQSADGRSGGWRRWHPRHTRAATWKARRRGSALPGRYWRR